MPLRISPVSDADWSVIVPFSFQAFAHEPYWQLLFPGGDNPANHLRSIERMTCSYKADPEEQYLKVYDDETGDIISCGSWCIYEEDPFARDGKGRGIDKWIETPWVEGKQKEHVEWVLNEIRDNRKDMKNVSDFETRAVTDLHLLFTDPKHQKRGAGSMLVEWGTGIADEMGTPCVVESSTFAHRVKIYEHHGFRDVRRVTLKDDERFPGLEAIEYALMYRPAPGEQ